MENNLKNILDLHNIHLSDEQIEKLILLKKETLAANKLFNITSIEDDYEFDIKMILDCLIFKDIFKKESFSLVDVGSGGGFPGLVLAIVFPHANILCLDATRKKCKHIVNMANKLQLSNVDVVCQRVEDFAINNREKYDFAIARALKSINILVELLTPLVKVDGSVIMMKSINYENELALAKNGIKKLYLKLDNIYKYDLDDNNFRSVLLFKKTKETLKKYPRRYDVIIKTPL